jgi:hypothetical protein
MTDEQTLESLFALLNGADDIASLRPGLRAMAATHELDVHLANGGLGTYFLEERNEANIRECEAGLRELGMEALAEHFREAEALVREHLAADPEFDGELDRLWDLTDRIDDMEPQVSDSPIYGAWVRYAKAHPEILGA